jgi:hypothetical protein
VISIVAYVIAVPGLSSDFDYVQDDVFSNGPPADTRSLSITTESTLKDNSFSGQEDFSSGGETGRIYCIIVGNYVNPENAMSVAEKYNSLGYQTNIITTTLSGGEKAELVPARIFSNYKDATSFLCEYRRRVEPGAWIFSN